MRLTATMLLIAYASAGPVCAGDCFDAGYEVQLQDGGPPADPDDRLSTWISGKRINGTAPDGENWKEEHCSTGELVKTGAGTPVDPRRQVGTWEIRGGPLKTVRYTYTGGSFYGWYVWRDKDGGGGLCWEDKGTGAVIATGPDSVPITGSCPPSP